MIIEHFNTMQKLDLPLTIKDSLTDTAELAHIRKIKNVTYIILNYPDGKDHLRSLCFQSYKDQLKVFAPSDTQLDLKHIKTFPHLLLEILELYESYIKTVHTEISKFENVMERLVDPDNVQKLYHMKKQMIHYQTALDATNDVINYISNEKPDELWKVSMSFDYATLRIETNQLIKNIHMSQRLIDSIQEASESMFSNKLNQTMKRLTSITLILSIPLFVTSFYGMNIELPFQDHSMALPFVFIISFVSTLGFVVYFYKKDLF